MGVVDDRPQTGAPVIDRLLALVDERVEPGRAQAVAGFAREYVRRLSDEADAADADALFHETLGAFELASSRDGAPVAVRAFNPTAAEHGYTARGAVLETNTDDLPFLVDSVSAELGARGLQIVRVVHPIIGTERDRGGRIVAIRHPREATAESVMHFALDRQLAPDEIAALEDATLLASALRDVRRLGIAPARLASTDGGRAPDDVPTHAALARLADAVTSVRGAADVTFMFARVLPLPRPWDPEHLSHVLRLVGLGAVANDATAFRRWLDAARSARRSPDGSEPLPLGQPWDVQLRDTLCTLWIDLAPTLLLGAEIDDEGEQLERAFETIAMLREERATREAELLVATPGASVGSMRARLQVLYGVLDATAHLVVWARRSVASVGVPAARDALHVSSAFTAGDRPTDTALQWLDLAVALPPLAASLPTTPLAPADPAKGDTQKRRTRRAR